MRFSDVKRGRRARHAVPFPLDGASWKDGAWTGETVLVDVRVLTPFEDIDVFAEAARRARDQGAEPKDGDPIYEYALKVCTIVRACIDHDSPADTPTPFFESFEQVVGDETISREHVAYLFEAQENWQSACSPRQRAMTPAQFRDAILRTAGGDVAGFLGMSPETRWNFTRSMAALLANSLAASSSSGEHSSPAPTGGSN